MNETWTNWSGSVAFDEPRIATPAGVEQIVAEIEAARKTGRKLRPVGSGHSFTPLVATEDLLLSLDEMQGVIDVDYEQGRARVLGGTKLKRLGKELAALGVAQESLGDIDAQSLAGATATGTHGTGGSFPSLSSQIVGLTLVTGTGEAIRCAKDENQAVFEAARLSLGALGVVAQVELEVEPAFALHQVDSKLPLDEVLERYGGLREEHRHFEFFWFPHSSTVFTKSQNQTSAPGRSRGPVRWLNEILLENAAFDSLSRISRRFPSAAPALSRFAVRVKTHRELIGRSHEVYATERRVRFQEMEYALPEEVLPEVIRELRGFLDRSRFPVHFPVECRFGCAEEVWLAPAYGRDTAYVAVHAYKGMPFEDYFQAAEAIFRSFDGRPHWGKMHSLLAEDLAGLYPRFRDFAAQRQALDPEGVFLSPYLRRLLVGS